MVVPFESDIEVDESQIDELQRWHEQMLQDMNKPAPSFQRAARMYQQQKHRDRLRQSRRKKLTGVPFRVPSRRPLLLLR